MLKEAAMIGQALKAAAFYFALVFAAGFVLGAIRTLWIVQRVGARAAELMETPIMFAVIVFAAHWAAEQFLLPPNVVARLGFGFVALGLLLVTEFTVVLWLRGLTIREYVASRDPVAGTVSLLSCRYCGPEDEAAGATGMWKLNEPSYKQVVKQEY
jgi:hypothetical protein